VHCRLEQSGVTVGIESNDHITGSSDANNFRFQPTTSGAFSGLALRARRDERIQFDQGPARADVGHLCPYHSFHTAIQNRDVPFLVKRRVSRGSSSIEVNYHGSKSPRMRAEHPSSNCGRRAKIERVPWTRIKKCVRAVKPTSSRYLRLPPTTQPA
jgi:hypothetical protein